MKYNTHPQHIHPGKSHSTKEYYRTHQWPSKKIHNTLAIALSLWIIAIAITLLMLFYPESSQSAEYKYNCSTPAGIAAMLRDLEEETIAAICASEEK